MVTLLLTVLICVVFFIVGIIIILIVYEVFDRSKPYEYAFTRIDEIPQRIETIFAQPSGGNKFGEMIAMSSDVIAVVSVSDVYLFESSNLISLLARPIHIKVNIIGIVVSGRHIFVGTDECVMVFGDDGKQIHVITGMHKIGKMLADETLIVTCEENGISVIYSYSLSRFYLISRMETGAIVDIIYKNGWMVVASTKHIHIYYKSKLKRSLERSTRMVRIRDETLIIGEVGQLEIHDLNNQEVYVMEVCSEPFRDIVVNEISGDIAVVFNETLCIISKEMVVRHCSLSSMSSIHWISKDALLVGDPEAFNGTGVIKRVILKST